MIAKAGPMSKKVQKAQLRAIRAALRTEDDFSKAAELFFDLSFKDASFDRRCRPTNDVRIQAMVQAALHRLYGSELDEVHFMGFRLKGTDLVHGSVLTPVGILGFFYFEKSRQGLVIATHPVKPGHTHLMRMTTFETPVSGSIPVRPAAGPPS